MSGTMTWKPASTSAGTWLRHNRPESGKPCSRMTGRPAPATSYSMPTPLTSARMRFFPSSVRDGQDLLAVGAEDFGLAPVRAEFDDLVEQVGVGEHLVGELEHSDDAQECPEDVAIGAAGGHQRVRHLVRGIVRLVRS